MKEKYEQIKKFFIRFKRRIMTMNKLVMCLFYIAVTWVLLMDFWLVNVPARYEFQATIGVLFRNLSFAYITACIFYFINVHIQNYATKVNSYRYINNKIAKFRELGRSLMTSIKEDGGFTEPEDKSLSEQEVIEICLKIHPYREVKLDYGRLSIEFKDYYTLFVFIDSETKRLVNDLLAVKESLDSEIMMLLTFIEDCTENHINSSKGRPIKESHSESDLGSYARGIYYYHELCNKIEKHLWENKKYKNYRSEFWEIQAAENLKQLELKSEKDSDKVRVS